MSLLLEICEVVVSYVSPTGSLAIIMVDTCQVSSSVFATSLKMDENFVMDMESWAWTWNNCRLSGPKSVIRLGEVTLLLSRGM